MCSGGSKFKGGSGHIKDRESRGQYWGGTINIKGKEFNFNSGKIKVNMNGSKIKVDIKGRENKGRSQGMTIMANIKCVTIKVKIRAGPARSGSRI